MILVRFCLIVLINILLSFSLSLAGAKSTHPNWKDKEGKKRIYTYEAIDQYTQEKSEIEVEVKPTPSEKLEKFSPDKIPQFLEGKETDAADIQAQSHPLDVLKHTAYDFPKESAVFFAGVGGVLLIEMLTQYEKNPMAIVQQFESLKNPVGHFSFFMFMYANRISMSFWPKLVKNPALWSYLGMTAGMLASDITSELLEPLRPCAKDLLSKQKPKETLFPKSCTQAYKDLVLTDKLLDLAPSLTSMMISTWLAGTFQNKMMQTLTSETLAQMSRQYLKWEFVNVLEFFAPGGAPTKLGAVVLNLVQISLFVGIDHQLSPYVKKSWNDVSKGLGLANTTRDLTDELLALKESRWQDNAIKVDSQKCIEKEGKEVCFNGFAAKLIEFREKMARWRQGNMETVRMAHQAWNLKLSKLSAMFDGSYDVYNHILNEILNSKQGKYSPIDEGDPYYGIKPLLKDGTEFPSGGYLDGSLQAQVLQRDRLKEGAKKIREEIAKYLKQDIFGSALRFFGVNPTQKALPPSLQKLQKVAELWEAREENRKFELIKTFRDGFELLDEDQLLELRRALSPIGPDNVFQLLTTPVEERTLEQNDLISNCSLIWFMAERGKMAQGTSLFAEHFQPILGFQQKYSSDIQQVWETIESYVGRPRPDSEPGRSYLRNFSLHPQYSKYFEMIDYPKNPGHYALETPAEYFVHQMVCGPDPENMESLVESSWYNYDQFKPPQIKSKQSLMTEFCRYEPFGVNRIMYTDPIVLSQPNKKQVKYKGIVRYLKENIRPEVLDLENNKNMLKPWWDKFVSPQIDIIFNHYAKDYQPVIDKFRSIVNTKEVSSLNMGPMFNSPVWALQQEARFYLLVINEMAKDFLPTNIEQEQVWGKPISTVWIPEAVKHYPGTKLPLLTLLKTNGPFDLAALTRVLPQVEPKIVNKGNLGDLELVRRIDYLITNLAQLTTMVGGSEKGRQYYNNQFTEAMNSLAKSMANLKSIFSTLDSDSLLLSQKETLSQSFEGLESLVKELNSYHLVVSLLSRDALGKVDDNNCRTSQNRAGEMSVDCSDDEKTSQ